MIVGAWLWLVGDTETCGTLVSWGGAGGPPEPVPCATNQTLMDRSKGTAGVWRLGTKLLSGLSLDR